MIDNSIELEEKSSPSDKLFNKLSIVFAAVSLGIFFICLVMFCVDKNIGLNLFKYAVYPIILINLFSYVFSIPQLLRNRYFSALLGFLIAAACLIGVIIFVVFQYIYFGRVYMVPFVFL